MAWLLCITARLYGLWKPLSSHWKHQLVPTVITLYLSSHQILGLVSLEPLKAEQRPIIVQ